MIENIAESRSPPSSPGAQDGDQFRSTPSKRAPVRSMAARERLLRASVFKSRRATPQFSNAYRNNKYLASVFSPVPWADAASQVYTTLGHAAEAYEDPDLRAHLLGGIRWAARLQP